MLAAALLVAAIALILVPQFRRPGFRERLDAVAAKKSRAQSVFIWAASVYATYGLTSEFALILLDRIETLWALPPEFAPFARSLGFAGEADWAALHAMAGAIGVGAVIGVGFILVLRKRLARRPSHPGRSMGAARAPNEVLAALVLSLSAGVSEELFFRLLLPLLTAIVFGSAAAGFALSLVGFGLMHRHQGVAGMVSVTLIGAALTFIYLLTGMLWAAIVLHMLIDVMALVVRPFLLGWIARPGG